jgi:crotonobetainyl-CoA:carnitine CoA-transferase CaiB-like acyl-CoA transferase
MPAGAYGDSLGGMTIAGGIAGALYARAMTGEPSVVDVSLLSVGTWAMALSVNNALLTGEAPKRWPMNINPVSEVNPLAGSYRTADNRWISINMLQPGRHWAEVCEHLGRLDLVADDRFDTAEKIMANAATATLLLANAFASRPLADWVQRFQTLEGQWAPHQDALEVGRDPQLRANGYVVTVEDADGEARELVANPVQFDETPPRITRAPQFAEHTDEILAALGKSEDEIIALKISEAVT